MAQGCLYYFPAALAGVARHSKRGNDKHNPGEPLHHSRGKSSDHADCIVRHLLDIGDMLAAYKRGPEVIDTEALLREADALVWRAAALSQDLYEKFGGAPLAPRARIANADKGRVVDRDARESECGPGAELVREQLAFLARNRDSSTPKGQSDR